MQPAVPIRSRPRRPQPGQHDADLLPVVPDDRRRLELASGFFSRIVDLAFFERQHPAGQKLDLLQNPADEFDLDAEPYFLP
ncbi:hypothetical protein J19TS2_40710 [Cohnella xylanilytica]|nr:hypothetical protein [Cohnella xylanilytica]GIO14516.1 hypothetical protein J19TS2_40710 [Cohnella xylanilytica]